MERYLEHTITQQEDGWGLEGVLKNTLGVSESLIRRNKHIPCAITLDGVNAPVIDTVRAGQKLKVLISDVERKSSVVPAKGPLDIVYEDEDIIILNKRAGDVVHPDHNHYDNTIGNYLLYYYDTKGDTAADFHPVQRLDNGTSGLLVAAKHAYAQNVLTRAMHTPSFERIYLALCEGEFDESSGLIDAPIYRPDPIMIKRCVDERGQDAKTEYKVKEQFNGYALVELKLYTGRTHQIRVHMAHIGHPLLGDRLYGNTDNISFPRTALHSWKLSFLHPLTGQRMEFESPAPWGIGTSA